MNHVTYLTFFAHFWIYKAYNIRFDISNENQENRLSHRSNFFNYHFFSLTSSTISISPRSAANLIRNTFTFSLLRLNNATSTGSKLQYIFNYFFTDFFNDLISLMSNFLRAVWVVEGNLDVIQDSLSCSTSKRSLSCGLGFCFVHSKMDNSNEWCVYSES